MPKHVDLFFALLQPDENNMQASIRKRKKNTVNYYLNNTNCRAHGKGVRNMQ